MAKICFRCGKEKDISEFYKHTQMADGYLNKCKTCTKLDSERKRQEIISDPKRLDKERKRQREKYHRLNYREKHNPSYGDKKISSNKYKQKHPEKQLAKNATQVLISKTPGNHFHHWSYNKEHYKDIIELSSKDHYTIHRFIKYDQKTLKYKDLSDNLLDTKEKHETYVYSILKLTNENTN